MTVFGWDASNHDWQRGPMDLAAAVRDGISFFTHKATEGTGYRDPYLGRAIQRAKDAGMPAYGAYMVPRSGTPVRSQVDFFLGYLDQQVPGWRTDPRFRILQMDTEHWPNDKVSATVGAQACAMLRPLGKYVVHYAPAWAYGNSIPGPDPLWASTYGTNPAAPYRSAYPGDRAWPGAYSGRVPAIWQYGARTTIGRQPTCDANVIKDPAVWAAITGGDDMSQQAESILESLAYGVDHWTDNQNQTRPLVPVKDILARSEWQQRVEDKLTALAAAPQGAVALSDADRDDIAARVLAKLGPALADELAKRLES